MGNDDTSIHFVKMLKDCVSEYKKQLSDTRDDSDAAHFFNPALKKFLKDNQRAITLLATMNFERPFISWMKNYLFKAK
jgi:hypothetical protein